MIVPAAAEAGIERTREKPSIPVEPALRLEEGEKEQARGAEEGKLGPVIL
jgi:hypothetical protein